MDERSLHKRKAQEGLLDIFSSATNLPIGLYEVANGELIPVFTKRSTENYELHCKLFQKIPGGREKCEQDQCNRAKNAVKSREKLLTLCHAGMYNQALPVILNGQVRAVILFGEMQIDDPEKIDAALELQIKTLEELNVSVEQQLELKDALLKSKRYSNEQLQIIIDTLPNIARWYYRLFEEEDRQALYVEKIIHDLQTRLQSVVGDAENLYMDFQELKPAEIKAGINRILNNAEALSTLINNLGDFQAEYKFEETRILPLFVEAKRIYSGEAQERHVVVNIDLDPINGSSPSLLISKDQMQLVVNNLIHNAVKYSFRGKQDHPRIVKVRGWVNSDDTYAIQIENYGVGITQEEIDKRKIFRDGYQGKLTEGEFRTGGGKGLFYVEKTIQEHNGRIEVSSKNMSDKEPWGQPHLNQFTVFLPIKGQ